MKIGLDFHFFLECNFIFYFTFSDMAYLNIIKQMVCANIAKKRNALFV